MSEKGQRMVGLTEETIRHVLSSVGLRVDFDSEGYRALAPELQDAVREAERAYREVVGAPKDESERATFAFMGREPGCKSALFHRLLSGREPFPSPPPTSYSYPWYDLLDRPGPRGVRLGGAGTLGSHFRAALDHAGDEALAELLSINQCFWRVQSSNDEARALLAMVEQDDSGAEGALAAARLAQWAVSHPGANGQFRVYWGTDGKPQQGWITGIEPSVDIGEFKVIRTIRTEQEDLEEQSRSAAERAAAEDRDEDYGGPMARAFARLAREAEQGGPVPRGPLVEYVRWGWMLAPSEALA